MFLEAEQPGLSSLLDRLVRMAVFVWLVLDVFDGALRYGANLIEMPWLVYVRDVVMLLAAIACLVVHRLRRRVFAYMAIMLLGALVGLAYLEPLQVAVGLKVFLPFFCGMAIAGLPGVLFPKPRLLVLLLATTVAGIVLQCFVDLPWTGFQYNIGDFSIEGNRMWWTTDEVVRLSGFCRASTAAAPLCFLFGLIILGSEQRRSIALACWLLALAGIVLTTSKGLCIAWVALSMLIVMRQLLAYNPASAHLATRSFACLTAAIGIVLPLVQLQLLHGLKYAGLGWFNLWSLGDRLEECWPAALNLAIQFGNPFTGRGVGGIGSAMLHFEPEMYNPADNLFLLLFVQFGMIAAILPFILALQGSRLLADGRSGERQAMGLFLVGMLVYGMVAAILECTSASLFVGYAAGLITGSPCPIQLPPLVRSAPPAANRPPQISRPQPAAIAR